jgi:hypothetical protein
LATRWGPPLLYQRDVTRYMIQTFPVKWVNHVGDIPCQPRLFDSTPMGFF